MRACHDFQYWGFLLAAVVAAAVYAFQYYLKKKRRDELARLALSIGCDFEAEAFGVPQQLLSVLPLFMNGSSRSASNLLKRSSQHGQMLAFDYSYVTGSGKNRSVHSQTVVAFQTAGFLPQFQLCPEHLGHKLMQLFGYADIDFAESQNFSRMYLLRGPDEQTVRSLFSAQARAFLEGAPGWHVDGAGQWLAVYKAGRLCGTDQYPSYIEQAKALASALGLKGMP